MFCPNCGKEILGGSNFCQECGKALDVKAGVGIKTDINDINVLTVIGNGLLVISFFMPWISAIGWFSLSVSGYELTKLPSEGLEKLFGIIVWLVPIAGGVAEYLTLTKNTNAKKITNIAFVVAIIVWVWFLINGISDIGLGNLFKAMGIGLYVMLAGIICLAIARTHFLSINNILKR